MFQVVDLKCTLTDLHVVTASADEAQVGFVQKTEKTGGEGQFQDNIVRGIHTLKLDDGKWKIFDTKRTSVTGLDGKPLGTPAAGPEQDAAPAPTTAPNPQSTPATEATPKPPAPAEKPPQ